MTRRITVTKHENPPDKDKHGEFSIFVAGDDLDFRPVTLSDRHVEVDQILRKGGYNPTLDHRLVELTFPGTKSWDDDETIDLKTSEPRHFLIGKSDRLFAFAIDDIIYETPFEEMGERQLRRMAIIGDDKILVLSSEDKPEQDLGPDDVASFAGHKVERLFSRDATVTVYLDEEGARELPRGTYMFKKIFALLGITAGFALTYVNAAGKLISFKDADSVDLFDGIKFFSHAAGGGAS